MIQRKDDAAARGNNGYVKMNLHDRKKKLETMIKCPSGKGQVYLRNFIDPKRRKNGPEIALRCKIREYLGEDDVLLDLEKIVVICCRNPEEHCDAYRRFQARDVVP